MAGFSKRWPSLFVILVVGGCLYPVRQQVDAVVCDLAAHPLDIQPQKPEELPKPMPAAPDKEPTEKSSSSPSTALPAPAVPEFRQVSTELQAQVPENSSKP